MSGISTFFTFSQLEISVIFQIARWLQLFVQWFKSFFFLFWVVALSKFLDCLVCCIWKINMHFHAGRTSFYICFYCKSGKCNISSKITAKYCSVCCSQFVHNLTFAKNLHLILHFATFTPKQKQEQEVHLLGKCIFNSIFHFFYLTKQFLNVVQDSITCSRNWMHSHWFQNDMSTQLDYVT